MYLTLDFSFKSFIFLFFKENKYCGYELGASGRDTSNKPYNNMLLLMSADFSKLTFSKKKKILSGALSECQTDWIQIRNDLSVRSVGPDLDPNRLQRLLEVSKQGNNSIG